MMTDKMRAKIDAATAKKWAKKQKKEATAKKADPVQSLKVSLLNISEGNESLKTLPVWSQIIQEADSQGHFATDIIEKAMSQKRISDKQAFVVAIFAKNNGII